MAFAGEEVKVGSWGLSVECFLSGKRGVEGDPYRRAS